MSTPKQRWLQIFPKIIATNRIKVDQNKRVVEIPASIFEKIFKQQSPMLFKLTQFYKENEYEVRSTIE